MGANDLVVGAQRGNISGMPIPWAQAREAWKALIEQARETRAATRNLRHLALLRRTLLARETRRDPGDSREPRRPEAP